MWGGQWLGQRASNEKGVESEYVMTLGDALVSIWQQVLADGKPTVELEGKTFTVGYRLKCFSPTTSRGKTGLTFTLGQRGIVYPPGAVQPCNGRFSGFPRYPTIPGDYLRGLPVRRRSQRLREEL